MGLDVLLQVLRTLEGLSAEVAFVWLKRDVDSDVGSDMVALDSGGTAGVPTTGKVQVVGALPADMFLADVLLEWKLAVLILSQVEGENEHVQRAPLQMCISRCTCPIGRTGCRPQ